MRAPLQEQDSGLSQMVQRRFIAGWEVVVRVQPRGERAQEGKEGSEFQELPLPPPKGPNTQLALLPFAARLSRYSSLSASNVHQSTQSFCTSIRSST